MLYNNIVVEIHNVSGSGSVVEHRLAKARVASSNLVFRSILFFESFNRSIPYIDRFFYNLFVTDL